MTHLNHKKGFTLIDVLIGVVLLVIIAIGIFGGFQLLLKILSQSEGKTIALSLSNEQIEIIRNLPYQDIGTENGIPAGEIPQYRTQQVNNRNYTISTDIIYIDDPFDQTSPNDELSADYKKARVEVSWQEHESIKSVIEIANFSPPNLESEVGGGTLSIYVNDSQTGQPIASAQTIISNDQVEPNIYISTTADFNGWLSRPGLSESTEYEVRVTQDGYNEHRTYSTSSELNPEPEYSHAQIIENNKTTRYFVVSKVSPINIKTVNNNNEFLPLISFALQGGRIIGINPTNDSTVYSYENNSLTTDNAGERQLNNMSPGEYYFEITNPLYAVLTPNLERPLIIESDVSQTITIALAPFNEPCLRVLVKDASTGNGIASAIARLIGDEYDKTSQTNEDGIAVFPFDEDELINGNYVLSVSKSDYQNYSNPQTVNNFTEAIIELIPND
ncbi:MAG: prepilin-type N-terminal cleavage/methylation domain-containing protein [bacterium]